MLSKRCLLLSCFIASSLLPYAQKALQNQAIVVKRTIELKHVQPRPVDDAYSNDLFTMVLDQLDPEKVFFTKTDVSVLEKYRHQLDDELNGKGWNFVPAIQKIFEQRTKEVQTFLNSFSKPFDFNQAETLNPQKNDWPLNEKALQDKWAMLLKLQTLNGLINIAQSELTLTGKMEKAKILSREPEQRAKARTKALNKLKNLLGSAGSLSQEVAAVYLNAIAMCFDPHSNFFDLTDKRNFQTSLNTDGYFFGFDLRDNEKDEVYIGHLMPGSAAWSCGKLNKGDVLLQLQWPGKEAIDVAGMTADEVNHLFDVNSDKLELTVRKTNGKAETVTLQKQKIENEDNIVKGFILNGEKKIGYINLPSFYTEWEDQKGSRCASDVAKEVIRLKKEGIEGLILDVRFNAGGAVDEAVDMAGIFIDEGPMCLLKPRAGKTVALKDINRGSIFDGPMVLMVNGQSASASEILAASLQDYNRAVIVGTPSFGKATSQEIMPADTTGSANQSNPEYGFVKLTTGKIYRVNGKSNQYSGVQPDIILPDLYEGLGERESTQPFALKPDSVAKNNYYHPLKPLPIAALKTASTNRIKNNVQFASMQSFHTTLVQEKTPAAPQSIKWDDIDKKIRKALADAKAGNVDADQPSTLYKPENHLSNKQYFQSNPVAADINKEWLSNLAADVQIEECYQILTDLIKLNKQ